MIRIENKRLVGKQNDLFDGKANKYTQFKTLCLALGAALVSTSLILAGSAQAKKPVAKKILVQGGAPGVGSGPFIVQKDHSVRLSLNGTAGSIIIANPRIADVTVVDSRTVFIMGRGYGKTDITITDLSGRTLWQAEVSVLQNDPNAVTLYRGSRPARMVCAQTCVEQETNEGGGQNTPDPASQSMPSNIGATPPMMTP